MGNSLLRDMASADIPGSSLVPDISTTAGSWAVLQARLSASPLLCLGPFFRAWEATPISPKDTFQVGGGPGVGTLHRGRTGMNDWTNAPGPSPFTEGGTFRRPSHGLPTEGSQGDEAVVARAGTEQQSPRWPSFLPGSPCPRAHSRIGGSSPGLLPQSLL